MNHSQSKLTLCLLTFSFMLAAGSFPALAKPQSGSSGVGTKTAQPADPTPPTGTAPAHPPTPGNTAATKTTASGAPSSSEIAAAKASGKVWVNTDSGVYHKGGRWYGKTKSGKFMTESEAKAAGYKEAHR